MKRIINTLILLTCSISGLLAADSLRIVVTASMFEDMTENIVGNLHSVKCIVPIGGDPHIYEPTPADAKLAADADIIFVNGLTFEGWLNELIANSGTKAKVYTLTEGINPIKAENYQNATDPHAWMVATNGVTYGKNILNAILEADPENEDIYRFNFEAYKNDLLALDAYIREQVNTIPEKQRILITSHDAFRYFGKAYGLQLESILGTSTDASAQTSDIQRITRVIRENEVPAVFIESTINPKLLKQIAKDNNIAIGGKLFSDSLGDKDSKASTYIDMLKHNSETIVAGLTLEKPKVETETDSSGNQNSNWFYYVIGGFILLLGGILIAKYK